MRSPRALRWARGEGVVLRAATTVDRADSGVQRALHDGIERGYAGPLSGGLRPDSRGSGPPLAELPPASEWYAIVAAGARVGVLAFTRDAERGTVTLHALAIIPEQRGHAYGARALLVAERRLAHDGVRAFLARVPRGNGHGLYFMMRCGYAPLIPPPVEDGTTWFRRHEAAARAARARAGPAPRGGTRA